MDPLFGSITAKDGTVHVWDDRTAPAEEPRVNLEMELPHVSLGLAELGKLIETLKKAQYSMLERKRQAVENRTLPLF